MKKSRHFLAHEIRCYRNQRGIVTLLFLLLVALGLAAVTNAALNGASSAQRMQYAEHTATQAEMASWTGVELLSQAVKKLPAGATLQPGPVVFGGPATNVSAKYIGLQNGYLTFDVTGTSAGSSSVLRVALVPPSANPPAGGVGSSASILNGITLHGNTALSGSVAYSGAQPANLTVLQGSLTMSGSVSGLNTVCADGNVTAGSAIQVNTICANGAVELDGSANVQTISATGGVLLAGGSAVVSGTVQANGDVSLTGGSASANTILSQGNVSVTGGSASAQSITAQGNVNWTSGSGAAAQITAGGTVNYRPSGTTSSTSIAAQGNVMLTTAQNVKTAGSTTLVGYYGQGIAGRLDSQGLLGGASWGAGGGAVVASGTVGSIVSPYPTGSVKVQVQPGYVVSLPAVTVAAVPAFTQPAVQVDANALKPLANLAFNGVDANGNPQVHVANVAGVTDGDYFIAGSSTGGQNYLCSQVLGTNCVQPLIKVCQGYSSSNACFSYSSGTWKIQGTAVVPWVLWFNGNLTVGNGSWGATFMATGNLNTSGGITVHAPNTLEYAYVCQGGASASSGLGSWTSYGFSPGTYASELCDTTGQKLTGVAVGNVALLAGSLVSGTFQGGNVSIGSSSTIFGSVMAGQYLSTSGSTTVTGSFYSAGQGGSTALSSNTQSGSTSVYEISGSSTYSSTSLPCSVNCGAGSTGASTAGNVVWAAPV